MKTQKRPWTRGEKALFFAPLLLALGASGAYLWQMRGSAVLKISGAESVRMVSWSPDSQRVALFAEFPNGKLFGITTGMVYEVRTRIKICDLTPPPLPLSTALLPARNAAPIWFNWPSWSRDGTRIATGYSDGTRGTNAVRYGLKITPGFVGKIALWDAQTGNLRGNWPYAPPGEDSFAGVTFTKDGRQLIGYEKPPAIFDATTGARLRRFGTASVREGSFNRGHSLVALSSDQSPKFEVHETQGGKVLWRPIAEAIGRARWNSRDILAAKCYVADKRSRLVL